MNRKIIAAIFLVIAFLTLASLACSLTNTIGSAAKGADITRAEAPYTDIPLMESMQPADLPMPSVISIGLSVGFAAAGGDLGPMTYRAYTTPATIGQVTDFYSAGTVGEFGWMITDEQNCGESRDTDTQIMGGSCAFGKMNAEGSISVFLVALDRDKKNNRTHVFIIRADEVPINQGESE